MSKKGGRKQIEEPAAGVISDGEGEEEMGQGAFEAELERLAEIDAKRTAEWAEREEAFEAMVEQAMQRAMKDLRVEIAAALAKPSSSSSSSSSGSSSSSMKGKGPPLPEEDEKDAVVPTSGNKKRQLDSRFALKKLPTYKGGHSEDFFAWYDEMSALRAFHRMSDDVFAQYIPWALEGAARQWLALQPEAVQASGQQAMAGLSVAYGHLTTTRLDERVRAARQGRDENGRDFWYRLQREAERLPGTFSRGQLEGRWRAGLQVELNNFMMQHADLSFDDQLGKLQTYEREWRQKKTQVVAVVAATPTTSLLSPEVREGGAPTSGRRERRIGPCWGCGEEGHLWIHCPKKASQSQGDKGNAKPAPSSN
jgi:hypothetical protein